MVALRTPTARTVGCDLGGLHDRTTKGAQQYGSPGDLCQHPGCHTILSATNDRDRCYCHGVPGKKRSPRRRGWASALREAQTTAAPEPRRVSREEIDMAAARRQQVSDAKAKVLAALTDTYQTAPEVAKASGVAIANVYYHCKRLVEEGAAENKLGKGGGYRRRQDVVKAAATVKEEAEECQASEAGCDIPVNNTAAKVTPTAASSEDAKSATPAPEPAGAAPHPPAEQPAPAAPVSGTSQEPSGAGTEALISKLINETIAAADLIRKARQLHWWSDHPEWDQAARDWLMNYNSFLPRGLVEELETKAAAEMESKRDPIDAALTEYARGSMEADGFRSPPFAGVDPRNYEPPAWSAPVVQLLEAQPVTYLHSPEVECMAKLEQLDDDPRERVLTWGHSRWPVAREVVVHMDCMPSAEQLAEAVIARVEEDARRRARTASRTMP